MSKRTLIHINQLVVRSNAANGQTAPCVTVKTYRSNTYAHEATVVDAAGTPVVRVIYRPDAPLADGGTVWIEAYGKVQPVQAGTVATDEPVAGAQQTSGDEQPAALYGSADAPVLMRVSKPTISANTKNGGSAPVLTLRAGDTTVAAHEAILYGPDGDEVAQIVYRPADPLSCGARLWVQTRGTVHTLVREMTDLAA